MSFKKLEINDLLNLDFFSRRFYVPREKLAWGVVISEANGKTSCFPAIMIKGANLYINISSDSLTPLINISGKKQTVIEATLQDYDANTIAFVFGNNNAIAFNKSSFFNIYRSKIYNDEIVKEAKCLN